MKITLSAGVEYRVRISPEPLCHDGERTAGLWVWAERTIWIDGELPVDRRREALTHELWHAWEFHIGVPQDPEARANNAAAFAAACRSVRQFDLEHLTAENIIDHTSTAEVPALPVGAECAHCGQRFSAQQIGDEPPRTHAKSGRPAIDRGVYCDHCNAVMIWMEAATEAGDPTGMVLNKPTYLRGQAMMDWLMRHEQSGVFVA